MPACADAQSSFNGTFFRFPLRSRPTAELSDISQKVFEPEQVVYGLNKAVYENGYYFPF